MEPLSAIASVIIIVMTSTGLFLFIIWRDSMIEKKNIYRENSQRNAHLVNLLEDTYHSIEQQHANNVKAAQQIRKNPTEAVQLKWLPTGNLKRLSSVLGTEPYFTAYNYSYPHIEQQQRITAYNDFSKEIDSLELQLAELKSYQKNSAETLGSYRQDYLKRSKDLLSKLTELLIELEEDPLEGEDKKELTAALYTVDTEQMYLAISQQEISRLDDQFIGPIHQLISILLRPEALYLKEMMELCDSCQQATEEYQHLIQTSLAQAQRLAKLNVSLEETMSSFGKKLALMQTDPS